MFQSSSAESIRRERFMVKSLSLAFSSSVGFFVPTLLGGLFFFTIIGVFGIWFAIGGLLLAVIISVAIFGRIPLEGEQK
jgi:hypothetical protein